MELHTTTTYLELVHLVGIGKRERTGDVAPVATLDDIAGSLSAIAIYSNGHIAHMNAFITAIIDGGINSTYRQFATQLATHGGGAGLADINLEIGLGCQGTDILHAHDLTKMQLPGAGITYDILVALVEPELELKTTHGGAKGTPEALFLTDDTETTHIADIT